MVFNINFFIFFMCVFSLNGQSESTFLIDADTGNEVDDLYALVRALGEEEWHISALSAAQWQASQWSIPETMENSHRLNQMLTSLMGIDVPLLRGAHRRMYDWGDQAVHNATSHHIIKTAHALGSGEKLKIIALGALTNVASALWIDPTIADKISLYWLGSTLDFENSVLNTIDFNCVMDIQATNMILSSGIDLTIMPINTAMAMEFNFEETETILGNGHRVGKALLDRWSDHLDGGQNNRILWDLALITAIIHPDMAETTQVELPLRYGNHVVTYYNSIDAKRIKADFYDFYKITFTH